MKEILTFFAVYHQAVKRNLAVSMDYSYDGFSSPDWGWITIVPGKKLQISSKTLEGIEWKYFTIPILVSYHEKDGILCEESSFHKLEKYSLKNALLGILEYLFK